MTVGKGFVTQTAFKKHLDGDWRTVHELWSHIRNYMGSYAAPDASTYTKTEIDAMFEGYSGGKAQVDAGNVVGLTQGSIPFADASGFLTEDNSNLFWDAANLHLGIDQAAPTARIDIVATGSEPGINISAGANGEMSTPDGEIFRWGHWNSGTTTFTERLKFDASGIFYVSYLDAGRVVFAGTGGEIKQNVKLFWDDGNARLGVGKSPSNVLDVEGAGTILGGVGAFTEVIARFHNETATKHTAISIDALAGYDPILYLSETASAIWDIRNDASETDKFQIRYQVGGANDVYFQIDNAGAVSIPGTLACGTLTVIGSDDSYIKRAATDSVLNIDTYGTNPTDFSKFRLRTSDSDTIDTLSETQDGDILGRIAFHGVDDASSFQEGVRITAIQNGAAGTNEVPTDLYLETYSATALNANQLVLHTDGTLSMSGALTVTQSTNSTFKRAAGSARVNFDTYADAGGIYSRYYMRTSDTDSIDTLSETQNLDFLGLFGFQGVNSNSAFAYGAFWRARQIGAAGANFVPTNLEFLTYSATGSNAGQLVLVNDGTITASGCITDGTCEIMKSKNALGIIGDTLNTGTGKVDKYGHEKWDMKKLYKKYPFLIYEYKGADEEGNEIITYHDKIGAKGDLAYAAILQLEERIEILEAQLNN